MFKMKTDKEIGKYLAEKIDKKYPSRRMFCRKYLKASDVEYCSKDEQAVQNMANRLSQILQGKKGIQTYDLPIFSGLLDISCEEILSAGEVVVPRNDRMNNYRIGLSVKKEEWEKYFEDSDFPVSYVDEYGRTILEYALDASNYPLLKYLMEKGYLWFDNRKKGNYYFSNTFGAGTSFKKRAYQPTLEAKLLREDQLRIDLITLAIKNDDLDLLKQLRAREIPAMYGYVYSDQNGYPVAEGDNYCRGMINALAECSNETILGYFLEDIVIEDPIRFNDGVVRYHTFVFPYFSQLLDALIQKKSNFAHKALQKAEEHNAKVEKQLWERVERVKNHPSFSEIWAKECADGIVFEKQGCLVSFRAGVHAYPALTAEDRIHTNISRVITTTDRAELKEVIQRVNASFGRICQMTDEVFLKKARQSR